MAFVFVSGNLALDLAGTLKWRRSEPEELLEQPGDLARWFDETGAMPPGTAVDAKAFDAAIALRESIYRLASARVEGEAFDPEALRLVNGWAAAPGLRVELTGAGVVRSGDVHNALAEVARSAVQVLADPDVTMKECGRPACTRIYLDKSRGARRTWCGMDECGNRVKAAAYRARKRGATPATSAAGASG
ncbi:CGNR zinc finger domain-containing protein [Mycolicibacterium sp.]|uniref:CGNR zinc finger domain-containing protein n=1 Tax=Mycolicibacterium sp. TaxID=2320850 RepID=UPI003D147FEE